MELPTARGVVGVVVVVYAVSLHAHQPLGVPQELSGSSPKRRRAEDKDEGIGSPDIWEDEKAEDLRREMIELRQQLDKERSVRMMLEEQVRRCCRLRAPALCRGWESGVQWGGQWGANQTDSCPGRGWSLSETREMSQRRTHCKHISVVKATPDRWAISEGGAWAGSTPQLPCEGGRSREGRRVLQAEGTTWAKA